MPKLSATAKKALIKSGSSITCVNPDGSVINAGPLAIDQGVKKPRGIRKPNPDSVLSQILALDVGGTYARAVHLDVDTAPWAQVLECKQGLRNSITPVVALANKELVKEDKRASLSIGDFRSQEGDLIICATVTVKQIETAVSHNPF